MSKQIHLAIPSKGRPDLPAAAVVRQWKLPVTVFVNSTSERKEYRRALPRAFDIVATRTHGIQHVRNAILEHFGSGSRVVMVDDDVKGLYALAADGKSVRDMSTSEIVQVIRHGFHLCQQTKTKLFGVYPIKNHFFMSTKVNTRVFIIGSFSGMIVSDLRYDQKLALKEDYDFTIKHVMRYGHIIRFDNICVAAKHYTNKGGAVSVRTEQREQVAIARLKHLYPHFVRDNPRRPNEILLKFPKPRKKED